MSRLPVRPAPAEGTSEAKRHILLVEDDPQLGHMCARALGAAGFEVGRATNGVAALTALERRAYDVVVSDVSMPQMDGLDLLRAVSQKYPDVPVILITASLDLDTYSQARESGTMRYLRKPFRLAQLEQAVRDAILLHDSKRRLRLR